MANWWGFRLSRTLNPDNSERHSGMPRTPSERSPAGISIVREASGASGHGVHKGKLPRADPHLMPIQFVFGDIHRSDQPVFPPIWHMRFRSRRNLS